MVSRKNVLKYYQVYDLPISYYSENPNVLFLTDNDGNDHKLVGISDLQFEELLEKRKRLTHYEVKHYASQILLGLFFLHENNIIHGNISTSTSIKEINKELEKNGRKAYFVGYSAETFAGFGGAGYNSRRAFQCG